PCGRSRGLPVRFLGEDDHLRGHSRDVEQPPLVQSLAERLGGPVATIGDDQVSGQEPLTTDLVEQLQGDLTLGLFAVVFLGDAGLLEPLRGTGPGLRDKEAQRRREMPLGTDIVERDGDLAVGLLAQLAAVLMLDADGMLALLGEAGIVDDEAARGASEGLGHHRAIAMEDLLIVPGTLIDELLQGLFRIADREELGREWDPADHGLDALTFAILEQATEIDAAPGALSLVAEIVLEEFGVTTEPAQDLRAEFGCMGLVHTIHTNNLTRWFVRFNGVVLATNTIAQGDTREVGLDQLADEGYLIPRAVPSRPWPGTASLEVAHVWIRRGNWSSSFVLDDKPAAGITSFLTEPGTVTGKPHRLKANEGKSFQGSIVLGMGFVLSPEEAQQLIHRSPRN